MKKLGINIDHIATLRNARGDHFPSLLHAAAVCEENGGDFITIHLREDRRHIRDNDLFLLNQNITTYLNLEMAVNPDILQIALKARPCKATLVPERREELTTEGGLDVSTHLDRVKNTVTALQNEGILVSLFVEADLKQLDTFRKTGARELEIHTGRYANLYPGSMETLLPEIRHFAVKAREAGFKVCAGHGLNYHNISAISQIHEIEEFNIGYSIITQAIFKGLGESVRSMKELIRSSMPEKESHV
jgi:pyridoxine 5-phosphate synthase